MSTTEFRATGIDGIRLKVGRQVYQTEYGAALTARPGAAAQPLYGCPARLICTRNDTGPGANAEAACYRRFPQSAPELFTYSRASSSEALSATAMAACPLTRSFQVNSWPLRFPFAVSFKPS